MGSAQHRPQHQRKEGHQRDEQLQCIEIEGLRLQQQPMHQRLRRVIDQAGDVVFVDDFGRGILCGDVADHVDIDDEQHDVGSVELPEAPEDSRRRHHEPAFACHSSEVERSGVACDEHEEIGGAAEAEIADRQQIDDVVRDMVEENEPVCDPARQSDPAIARAGCKTLIRRLVRGGQICGGQVCGGQDDLT